MKKVYVLIGNFGSGKTELALHLAFKAAEHGRTELLDVDMVNTYFRLSERRELIAERGIRLVTPHYVSTNIETLSLPAEVSSAFDMDWDTVVFDAGGDPAGATALGRFAENFAALEPEQLTVLNVVNTRRPMSGTSEKVTALMREMERNSRLRVTGFVNNTNLAHLTTADELREGYEVLREVSDATAIPVLYTSGLPEILAEFLTQGHDPRYIGEPIAIETHMHRDWDRFTRFGV